MKIHLVKEFQFLLFALVSMSTLASLPQAESAWAEVKEIYSKQDFGLHVLRQAMLVGLASQQGTEIPFGLDDRISDGGRLVWKTPESSLSACGEIHGRDRRQDTRI